MSEPAHKTAPDDGYTLSWDWKESLPLALDDIAEVLANYGVQLTDISDEESDQIKIHICAQEAEPAPARVSPPTA